MNEIITVKQLPIIVEQLQTIKEDVTARVTDALSLVCTDETVKTVKQARADLNAELKGWEDKRKEVKKAVLTPYEQFEAVYKECISDVFKKADSELKGKIDSVENELKEQKRQEVKALFEEYRTFKGIDFVTFETANINITLSASTKALKLQAKNYLDKICDDLQLINTQQNTDEILYEYKQTLNVSRAIQSVTERHRAIEEAKAREAEQQARAQAIAETEKKVDEIAPPAAEPIITAPVVEEADPVLTLAFKVTAPKSKLKELKAFLINGGYDYE